MNSHVVSLLDWMVNLEVRFIDLLSCCFLSSQYNNCFFIVVSRIWLPHPKTSKSIHGVYVSRPVFPDEDDDHGGAWCLWMQIYLNCFQTTASGFWHHILAIALLFLLSAQAVYLHATNFCSNLTGQWTPITTGLHMENRKFFVLPYIICW